MVRFVKKGVAGFTADEKAQLQQVITALSAEAHLKSQQTADQRDAAVIKQGIALLTGELDSSSAISIGMNRARRPRT